MNFDTPEYYSTLCPVDILGCDRLPTPEAVVDHLLAEHDPRVIATALVRESCMYRRISTVLDGLSASIEHEVDALLPDPMAENDIIEIEFDNER